MASLLEAGVARKLGKKIFFFGDKPAQSPPVGLTRPHDERACYPCDLSNESWAAPPATGIFAACPLHEFLRAHACGKETVNDVLWRLSAEERTRLRELGVLSTGELATPPAKRARRV